MGVAIDDERYAHWWLRRIYTVPWYRKNACLIKNGFEEGIKVDE